jgi:threonine dehydrogenase-like Zn-dependent dehydrogenase
MSNGAELAISVSSLVERRSCNPEVTASFALLRLLEDSLLAMNFSLIVRRPRGRQELGALGAGLDPDGVYDVVVDAVGSTDSLSQAVSMVKPKGRIGMVGTFWEPVSLDSSFGLKEAELVSASGYHCKAPQRNFEEAGRLLHARPAIAEALVTHRFPLDAVDEAFAAAADRAAGAIKVVFDVVKNRISLHP